MTPAVRRLGAMALAVVAVLTVGAGTPAAAQEGISSAQLEADLFHDPASPVAGNPAGSVTVVEFFDYRCPYCRAMQPTLQALLARDKTVRLVLKDWPIFGGASIDAARLAIAASWQGKYLPVHDAFFALPRDTDRAALREAVKHAGVDMARLDSDMAKRSAEIAGILGRTDMEARLLQLQGTPGFVIGHHVVPGALSLDDLEALIAKVRNGQ